MEMEGVARTGKVPTLLADGEGVQKDVETGWEVCVKGSGVDQEESRRHEHVEDEVWADTLQVVVTDGRDDRGKVITGVQAALEGG